MLLKVPNDIMWEHETNSDSNDLIVLYVYKEADSGFLEERHVLPSISSE